MARPTNVIAAQARVGTGGGRSNPDGSEKSIPRPYYAFYMPRERWALVHFDEKALIFARRDAVPADWLAAREFRWLRPNDELALQDALSRGEVPRPALARELERASYRSRIGAGTR